jgi:hypothetical protein
MSVSRSTGQMVMTLILVSGAGQDGRLDSSNQREINNGTFTQTKRTYVK